MADLDDSSAHGEVDDISKPSLKAGKDEALIRKVICRYGSGCTHILDPTHREKFWHPKVQRLNEEQIKSHFICNECGFATNSLSQLQLHLKRKTAWSNNSLIGCRVNCLVDYKEWHEGYVTQYHKSGKHLVEFRMVNEKRWLLMKKVAFYIVERPNGQINDGGEFKETNTDHDNLAPVEDSWVFCEDISLEYAFAQSVLFKIYGNALQETGHLTRGHVCLTESDRIQAMTVKSSLLYGELLPRGANKVFGVKRLEAQRASSLFDLGMGTGKIVIQAFLQYRNLKYCYGVELSQGRYKIAEETVLKMVQLLGCDNYNVQIHPGKCIIVTEAVRTNNSSNPDEVQYTERVLHFQCGNMFDTMNIETADIVMMETDIPLDLFPLLHRMISSVKEGARILSYLDLRRLCGLAPIPLKQLEVNRHLSDRYPTSWSVQRGHHFFLWQKTGPHETSSSWSNGLTLGLGSLVSHDNSGGNNNYGSAGSPLSAQNNKPSSPNGSFHLNNNPNSRDYSQEGSIMENGTEDVDSTRCFPFGIRLGFGRSKKNAKNKLNAEDCTPPRVIIPVNAPEAKPSATESAPPSSLIRDQATNGAGSLTPLPTDDPVSPKAESPLKLLNLSEINTVNNSSPRNTSSRIHSNNNSPGTGSRLGTPPKSDRSKSSTHGNLILNNSHDILDYPGTDNHSSFTPIQGTPLAQNIEEIESFGKNNNTPNTNKTLQFPADIRSKIRSSPLIDNNGMTSGSVRTSKENPSANASPQEKSKNTGSNTSSTPSANNGKKRGSVSPRRASRNSEPIQGNHSSPPESSSSRNTPIRIPSSNQKNKFSPVDENYHPIASLPSTNHSISEDLPTTTNIPPLLLGSNSNDVIHHTQVKPAVTSSSVIANNHSQDGGASVTNNHNNNNNNSNKSGPVTSARGKNATSTVESYYNNNNNSSNNNNNYSSNNASGRNGTVAKQQSSNIETLNNHHRSLPDQTGHYQPSASPSVSSSQLHHNKSDSNCVIS